MIFRVFDAKLWPIPALGVFIAFALPLILARPLEDFDLLTQLVLGESILGLRQAMTGTALSLLEQSDAALAPGAIAQMLFAAVTYCFSWKGLHLFYALLFCSSFIIVALAHVYRRGEQGLKVKSLALLIALLLALSDSLTNSAVRPQGIAFFCFAILILVAERKPSTVRAALCLTLFVVWQNSHPSLSLASTYLACLLLASFMRGSAHGVQRYQKLLFFLSIVAHFCTPAGIHLLEVSKYNVFVSRELLHISEWMPPWDSSVRDAMAGFWVCVFASAILSIRGPGSIERRQTLPALLLFCLSLYSSRFCVFWALCMIPLWCAWLENWIEDHFEHKSNRYKAPLIVGVCLLSALGTGLILIRSPDFPNDIPLAQLRILKEKVPEGVIYNYREWAGPIQYVGAPQWKTIIDGRLYLFPRAVWSSYYDEGLGLVSVENIQERYGVKAFVLHKGFHEKLIALLNSNSRWREFNSSSECVIFVYS